MPYSSSAGKNWIRERLPRDARRVLDVGVGAGQYSDLFRPTLSSAEWIGIEVWAPYVERFNLTPKYDQLIIGDARWVDFNRLGSFDVCFCGDILEHMQLTDAQSLVQGLLNHCTVLFISVPLGHCPQDAVGGNPYEHHVSDNLTDADIRGAFSHLVAGQVETVDQWTVGTYALTRDLPSSAILAEADR